jgi:RecB family exonuclease
VTELPTPIPLPVASLSPTAANDLLACPYRLAWRLDPRFKSLRRPSPWSSLGVVAHAVAEDVARGLLGDTASDDDARAQLEARWNAHVASASQILSTRWAPASPPEPDEWPGYHLIRARTIRRALRQRAGHQRLSSPSSTTAFVEESFDASDSGLNGRPDRVEGSPGNLCVVDLKTGLSQVGPTTHQRRQLLVYCHLVGASTGDVPTRIAVEDPSGRRWEESVTIEEIDGAVR